MMEWKNKSLVCEFQAKDKIKDVKKDVKKRKEKKRMKSYDNEQKGMERIEKKRKLIKNERN